MRLRHPDYLDAFHCLAGDCPRSCCIGWEVVIDPDTVRRYRGEPGDLGRRLRGALQTMAGEDCFLLRGGRCPFLDGAGLCEIHRTLGAEATSLTCRTHPRFTEDYGPLREINLSASCPAVSALVLGSAQPLTFPESVLAETGEAGDAWLAPLLESREQALRRLRDRTRPLGVRLGEILCLSAAAQELLEADRASELPALWASPVELPAGDVCVPDFLSALLHTMEGLEILDSDWPGALSAAEHGEDAPVPAWAMERVAAYFLFGHFLKAVNDGDLLGRVMLSLSAVLIVRRLASPAGMADALCRFSREIEHSAENLTALRAAFALQGALSPDALLSALIRLHE